MNPTDRESGLASEAASIAFPVAAAVSESGRLHPKIANAKAEAPRLRAGLLATDPNLPDDLRGRSIATSLSEELIGYGIGREAIQSVLASSNTHTILRKMIESRAAGGDQVPADKENLQLRDGILSVSKGRGARPGPGHNSGRRSGLSITIPEPPPRTIGETILRGLGLEPDLSGFRNNIGGQLLQEIRELDPDYQSIGNPNITDVGLQNLRTDLALLRSGAPIGEAAMDRFYAARGFERLEARLPGNRGFDGVYVIRIGGRIVSATIGEAKFTLSSSNRLRLSNTVNMGQQMSRQWVDANIANMRRSPNPEVRRTASLLTDFKESGGTIRREGFLVQGNRFNGPTVNVRFSITDRPGTRGRSAVSTVTGSFRDQPIS